MKTSAVHLYRDKRVGNEADFSAYLESQLTNLGLPLHAPADVVGLFIGGNAHNTLGLVELRPPFDYVLPERPELPLVRGAQLVPERAVREVLGSRMEALLCGLETLGGRFGSAAVCVESPPPLGDDEYVRQCLDEHFRKDFLEGRDIVPAALRYKLWRTSCSIFERRCRAIGLAYLATPPAAMECGMYLHRAGYPLNVTHGNAWFGSHVLDALLARRATLEEMRTS